MKITTYLFIGSVLAIVPLSGNKERCPRDPIPVGLIAEFVMTWPAQIGGAIMLVYNGVKPHFPECKP
jgi:hypothetical protein